MTSMIEVVCSSDGRQHEGVRRRAERAVGAVDLEAGGAAADQAEIADQLVAPTPSKMKAARGSKLSGWRR